MKPARIVVLIIAIAAGGIAALLAGRQEEAPPPPAPVAQIETGDVLVASKDIPVGHALSPDDLRWQAWPVEAMNPHFIRKGERPDAIAQSVGLVARQSFLSGEPVRESKLINAKGSGFMAAILPPGMRAVSIEISTDASTAGGFILPNDRVDVVLSLRRSKEDSERASGTNAFFSQTVISNVRVLAVDQQIEEKNGQRAIVGAKTVTLELSPGQAEKLAKARQIATSGGTLSLVLRSLVEGEQGHELAEDNNGGQGVNVVRFGISTAPSN